MERQRGIGLIQVAIVMAALAAVIEQPRPPKRPEAGPAEAGPPTMQDKMIEKATR